ncbi:MAG: hypothetical protein NXH95_12460 [Pseudomonadaceae bacterium]|nr:hypothetical protein [Pseudomonadaceae bacterium]
MTTYIEQLKRTSFAGVLRTLGALVIVAGLCSHLLQGWSAWGDLSRLYVLLGVTAAFAITGFAVSGLLREQKGARVFVSLALVAVVASLTTLGGLLEEIISWTQPSTGGVWQVDGLALQAYAPGQLGVMFATALFTLMPVTWMAFRVLARPQVKQLSLLFALCSLLICIPARESWPLGLTILISLALPAYYAVRAGKSHIVFATLEGRFALLSLFFPALVMLARLFWLYEADALLSWMLLTISFIGIHLLRLQAMTIAVYRPVLSAVGLAVFTGVAMTTVSLLDPLLAGELMLPLAGLLMGFACFWSGMLHPRVKSGFELLASLCMAIAVMLNLLFNDAWLAVGAGVFIGLLISLCGRRWVNLPVTVVGAGVVLASVISQLPELGRYIDFTHWITLGVLGMSLLGVAVYVEKRQIGSVNATHDDAA